MRVSWKQGGGGGPSRRRWCCTTVAGAPIETRHEKLPLFPRSARRATGTARRNDVVALANGPPLPSPRSFSVYRCFPPLCLVSALPPSPLSLSLSLARYSPRSLYRKYNWRFANPLTGPVWQVALPRRYHRGGAPLPPLPLVPSPRYPRPLLCALIHSFMPSRCLKT
jgi:hypothetical protein